MKICLSFLLNPNRIPIKGVKITMMFKSGDILLEMISIEKFEKPPTHQATKYRFEEVSPLFVIKTSSQVLL